MGKHARCAADKRCEFFRATCSRNHVPEREWGGIGNTLPIYARTATRAFRQNCTVSFSNTDRSFQLQHHFLEPQLIPRLQQMPDARGCAGIALTSNPSKEVAALVQSVHNVLQTAEVRSGSGESRCIHAVGRSLAWSPPTAPSNVRRGVGATPTPEKPRAMPCLRGFALSFETQRSRPAFLR